jgi:tetratricopeptide (TPR) repeat protein
MLIWAVPSWVLSLGVGQAASQTLGLDDDAVLAELARRDLATLLEHAFERANTPEATRRALRARMSLNQLRRDDLTPNARRELVKEAVAGLTPEVIRRSSDPVSLAEQAELLIADGIAPDINTLEYWGSTAFTQNQVRPVIESAILLLDAAIARARQQAEATVIRGPNDIAGIERVEKLVTLDSAATDLRQQLNYYYALSLHPTDPRRGKAVDEAVAHVAPFDTDDNPMRQGVQLFLGKAELARLTPAGHASARTLLDAASSSSDPGTQFEARYFRVVVEVLAGDAGASRAALDAIHDWANAMSLDADTRSQWSAALRILDYRVLTLEASAAPSDQRDTLRRSASTALMQLLEVRPDLTEVISRQLLAQSDASVPLDQRETLLLKAMLGEGETQVLRYEAERVAVDQVAIGTALDAAREILRRSGAPDVPPNLLLNARFLQAVFLERLDRPIEAASAYLDFVEEYRAYAPDRSAAALGNAQRLIGSLRQADPDNPDVVALVDRVFPLAIDEPFNQLELCFAWASRLAALQQYEQAIGFYRRVGRDDPNHDAARYGLLTALSAWHSRLDPADPQHDAVTGEMFELAREVRASATRALADASPDVRPALVVRAVGSTLLAADMARVDADDPAQAAAMLEGFEELAREHPDASAVIGQAMFIRVQSLLALSRTDEAVRTLLQLLDTTGGASGGQIVASILERLEAEFDEASARDDRARMASIVRDRASLTPRLVEWASQQTDPAVTHLIYRYRVYDAETQRLAAEFVEDESARRAALEVSLQLFEALDAPEGFALFKASLTPDEARRVRYDRAVALALARLHDALGNDVESRNRFGRLLVDQALGPAVIVKPDPATGLEMELDNEAYWEAVLKWTRAAMRLGEDLEPYRRFLREQDVRWGDRVGGSRWRGDFDRLRAELGA